jgi:hydroxymethylpyrimidine/phosphomethylpyrimidine kinase
MVTVMTIAGFDPSGGAGIAADVKTFCALNVYPTCVISCITSQNDEKYYKNVPVEPAVVKDQIKAITDYYEVRAVKIGMLYSKENIKTAVKAISQFNLRNIVLDPVIMSSTGRKLIDYDISHLKNELLPHVDLLTPNITEAEALSGKSIVKIQDIKEIALEISSFGCENIVITGYNNGSHVMDMFYDGENFIENKMKMLKTPPLHGTGCTFSAAAAAFLALGKPMRTAVKEAKEFTYNSMKYACILEEKKRVLNHLFMRGR